MNPLKDRTFRLLYLAQLASLFGTGLTTVALALLAYDLAAGEAGVVLGTALAIKMIAYVTLSPLVGAFANKLPRKSMLIVLDLARAGIVMLFPLISEVWQIYVVVFALQACSAGFTPTFQATIPDILTEEARYTRALSLSRLAYDLENVLSPFLAAAALVYLSYDRLFMANAATFVISAFLVAAVTLPRATQRAGQAGFWSDLTRGFEIYFSTARLRGLLALNFAFAAAGSMAIVNTVIYVRDLLGGGESETALAFAVWGAGSMMVALSLPRVLVRISDRPVMLTGAWLMVAGLLIGLLPPAAAVLMVSWCMLGAGSSFVLTPTGRLLTRSAAPADRASIFATHFALSHLCWLVTYPLAGWLGARFGLWNTFVVLAVIASLSIAAAQRLWPRDDRQRLVGDS
jgi:MFS family permease